MDLDYFETFFTLIDVMAEVYHKLLVDTEGPIRTQASYFELILICDGKFKVKRCEFPVTHLTRSEKVVVMITKELDLLPRNVITEELSMIDPLATASNDSDLPEHLE